MIYLELPKDSRVKICNMALEKEKREKKKETTNVEEIKLSYMYNDINHDIRVSYNYTFNIIFEIYHRSTLRTW